jgi:hypothetical protein
MPDTSPRRKILTTPLLKSNVDRVPTEFDNKDDLTDAYKQEYSAYAAEQSHNVNDKYPLSKVFTTLPASSNPDGSTNPITDIDPLVQPNALQEVDGKTKSEFNSLSDSKMLAGAGEDFFHVKKGKELNNGPTPEFLFNEAQTLKQNSTIANRVRRLLIDNNGLDKYGVAAVSAGTALPGASVVQHSSARADEDRVVATTSPSNTPLGVSFNRKFPEVTPALAEANLIKIKDLKKLGLAVMLGASGEVVEPNYSDPNFDTTGQLLYELASTAPALTRLGQKVPVSRFSAAKVFEKIKPGSGLGESKVSPLLDSGDEGMSYGSPNNPFVPSSGLTSIAQMTSVAVLVLAFGTLLKTTALLGSITLPTPNGARVTSTSPIPDNIDEKRRHLGKAYGTADISAAEMFISSGTGFNVMATRFDFDKALSKGVDVFFAGTSATDTIGATAAGTLANVAKAPGFYTTLLSEILRDLNDLGLGSSIAPFLGQTASNQVSSLRESLDPQNLISNIKESKLFRFINILASLGDISLSVATLAADSGSAGIADGVILTEDEMYGENVVVRLPNTNIPTDSTLLDPTVHQIKHRLSDGKNAWANNSLRSLLLFPAAIADGRKLLGINEYAGDVLKAHAVVPEPSGINATSGRIQQHIVEAMEKYLEKDYMPFYFHDLRTNEIVTTPAFIESIDESFTAEYAETEGFGRIGSVPVYKNTKRTISISFKMIAMNDDDHSAMWYKINRLGMMLMPQWSKGRQIQFGSNKIIQPFSQQIAAAPLIRLRLGDLYKTNYSQFGLARLFGIASGGGASDSNAFNLASFEQNPTAVTNARQEAAARTTHRENVLGRMRNRTLLLTQRFPVGTRIRISQATYYYVDPAPVPTTPVSAAARARNARIADNYAGRGPRVRASAGRIPLTESTVRVAGYTGPNPWAPDCLLVEMEGTPANGTSRRYFVEDGPRIILTDISLIPDNAGTTQTQPQLQSNSATTVTTQEFMSDRNPVFKAFKSTRGKGLPGFITGFSLGIDVNHKWLIEKFNARAPQIVTITMQFNPLYDIQPGLDHNGFMTAPLWNVGDVMKANFSDTTSDGSGGIESDSSREGGYNDALKRRGSPRRIM